MTLTPASTALPQLLGLSTSDYAWLSYLPPRYAYQTLDLTLPGRHAQETHSERSGDAGTETATAAMRGAG
ncbi:hypothetical protein [Amycolatopsis sp. PS_44_ISF1]|uniref:hypothetical protein n=1 Tax=Amycolatopsis sp. PS_44_ISF1 TaxID=2974917 RepID=UPI0028DE879D|nr:hypothetical protein [Amycolatopsis sp. PS_44_ISF1]MDT8913529.1 hypothetical protein [Amycolatopsis sp. PS_44_ISF1]